MSVAVSTGPKSLIQLGLGISDVALVYRAGSKLGNWLFAPRHDKDLFEYLMEDKEALLQRKCIVDRAKMESMYRHEQFIFNGQRVNSADQHVNAQKKGDLDDFGWLMAVIVSALDICMPPQAGKDLIIDAFVEVLGNPEAASPLRVNLDKNMESWRQVGTVRSLAQRVQTAFRQTWKEKVDGQAVPQLNRAEAEELTRLLVVLFKNETNSFNCISAATFSIARAIQNAGISISTDDHALEWQLHIKYTSGSDAPTGLSMVGGRTARRAAVPNAPMWRAIMLSYPAGQPQSMIQAAEADRSTINRMEVMWQLGEEAGSHFRLQAKADLPFADQNEFYYELEGEDDCTKRISTHVSMLSSKSFPIDSQHLLSAVEELLKPGRTSQGSQVWLSQHTGLEYLLKAQPVGPVGSKADLELWLAYQALVFGFYYKLLEPLVELKFLSQKKEDTYFRGLWGHKSTTFLAMCIQFGQELREHERVGRTHVTYMLATMYGGRQKVYSTEQTAKNLLGVMGPLSILALPLMEASDTPQQLARYAVLDLPVVQLVGAEDGELYAGTGFGISFGSPAPSQKPIEWKTPSKAWSVNSSMTHAFRNGGGSPGVVMSARCGGRLVGWFSPVVAETMFLSSNYQQCRGEEGGHEEHLDGNPQLPESCFEVTEQDWESGHIPLPGAEESFGIVHSTECPALRYAAAGFYGHVAGEVAIATDDISAAFGRVQAQGSGIIIT